MKTKRKEKGRFGIPSDQEGKPVSHARNASTFGIYE